MIIRYTHFHVRTWSWECLLTPLALAEEIAALALDLATVLFVLMKNAGMNPNEPYVIDDFTERLRMCTNALTHLLAQWDKEMFDFYHCRILHTLLKYGADARAPARACSV